MTTYNAPTSIDFKDNKSILIVPRPRLHAIDVTLHEAGKRTKFVGRFSDNLSEWTITKMMVEDYGLVEEEEVA